MKQFAIALAFILSFTAIHAKELLKESHSEVKTSQQATATTTNPRQELEGQYAYQIVVSRMTDESAVTRINNHIDSITNSQNRGWTDLRDAIVNGYKSTLTQKTVNASANLLSFGVSLIVAQMEKNSKNFESWSKAKQQQCTYTKDLSSEEKIDDFYYLPSTNGALDPRNLKFNGFTCRNYIAVNDSTKPEQAGQNASASTQLPTKSVLGHDAFYIACSLRTDSLGIAHMANHSKFMLTVDTLIFYPRYCNIPNINGRRASESFDFDKLANLEFQMNVKVSSSWINEAIMVTSDQQLGEFVIHANINKNMLINDSVFFYDGKNPETLGAVTISGDSFIVPRSYIGTSEKPAWGTGQYKLDMTVSESCQLNADYYHIEGIGNGQAVNFANLPGYKRWDKKVWQAEWHEMNSRPIGESWAKSAWRAIRTAYLGDNWVKELIDPAATALYQEETTQLKAILNLDDSTDSSQQQSVMP